MLYESSFVQHWVLALVNVVRTQLRSTDVFKAVRIHEFVQHWKHLLYESMVSYNLENVQSTNPGVYNVHQRCRTQLHPTYVFNAVHQRSTKPWIRTTDFLSVVQIQRCTVSEAMLYATWGG